MRGIVQHKGRGMHCNWEVGMLSVLTGQLSVHYAERFAGEVSMNDAECRMQRAEQRREVAGATTEMEEDATSGDAPCVQPNQLLDLREFEVPVEVPGRWERRMVAIEAVPVLVRGQHLIGCDL